MAAPDRHPRHDNNFDAMRMVAALAVLVNHQLVLIGRPELVLLDLYSLGTAAVLVFFIISGYLVTDSWYRDPSAIRFAARRVLRIWPALTAVVLLAAFVLGPCLSVLPPRAYFSSTLTYDYLETLLMRVRYILPGVFPDNPYADGVNGSLWTIPIEVRAYVVLALAGLLGLLRSKAAWLAFIAIFLFWYLTSSNPDLVPRLRYARHFSAFFLIGSALFVLRPRWQCHGWLCLVLLAGGALLAWSLGWRHLSALILLPFLVIFLGTRSTPFIRRLGRWGDPSYGIYVIAFPVQQTMVHFFWPRLGFAALLALSLTLTVALAYLSWHFIEKPALRLKPHRPRSGNHPGQSQHGVGNPPAALSV